MATFKAEVYEHQQKRDGTFNIKIRVIHNKKKRYLATTWYVTKSDLTRSFRIKNQRFIDMTDDLIRTFRRRCDNYGPALQTMDIDKVVDIILKDDKAFTLDFVAYTREHIARLRSEGRTETANQYSSSINSLIKYVGSESIDINDISSTLLNGWKQHIINSGGKGVNRAEHYATFLAKMHKKAKMQYNDEELGRINIPFSPFQRVERYRKTMADKRAIPAEAVAAIFAKPYHLDRSNSAYNFALDLFRLSFFLIGINVVDLYTCTDYRDGRLTYRRQKTTNRRADKAEISIKVEPEVLDLFDKYRDKTGARVFNFYQKYNAKHGMINAINRGLKIIGNEIGIDNLQYYAARHSWATIAVNDVGIDKYVVHQALNHADPSMRVTDMYIRKSYKAIDEANRRVIDYIKQLLPPSQAAADHE